MSAIRPSTVSSSQTSSRSIPSSTLAVDGEHRDNRRSRCVRCGVGNDLASGRLHLLVVMGQPHRDPSLVGRTPASVAAADVGEDVGAHVLEEQRSDDRETSAAANAVDEPVDRPTTSTDRDRVARGSASRCFARWSALRICTLGRGQHRGDLAVAESERVVQDDRDALSGCELFEQSCGRISEDPSVSGIGDGRHREARRRARHRRSPLLIDPDVRHGAEQVGAEVRRSPRCCAADGSAERRASTASWTRSSPSKGLPGQLEPEREQRRPVLGGEAG